MVDLGFLIAHQRVLIALDHKCSRLGRSDLRWCVRVCGRDRFLHLLGPGLGSRRIERRLNELDDLHEQQQRRNSNIEHPVLKISSNLGGAASLARGQASCGGDVQSG
uniref:(northern house mosquito) hypothetical protein n=1 Tax=Culex pipiens TaxID=7175 RepID=A0A8D8BE83_CULPI